MPLFPEVASPVVKVIVPDTLVPASAVMIARLPLWPPVPVPDRIANAPPVAAVEVPALSTSSPPVPLSPVPTAT
jgi:hypothetical protein